MKKKIYYDENGKPIRSKPTKKFYKKRTFWVGLIFISILTFFIFNFYASNDNKTAKPDKTSTDNVKSKPNKTVDKAVKVPKKSSEEKQSYTYEDFKGTYALFEGNPYKSGIESITSFKDGHYETKDFWEFNQTSKITSKSIEGNILKLDYHLKGDYHFGHVDEVKTEEFELNISNGVKSLRSLTDDYTIYSMSEEDLQNNYKQEEIDYARIVMTVIGGDIPNDSWAVSSPVTMRINHSEKNESLGGFGDAPFYPENVTHLTSNLLGDLSHLSGSIYNDTITYHAEGGGYMSLYYLNQEESTRVGQEKIEDLGTVFIEPSEPHFVADFIGRVEFIYE